MLNNSDAESIPGRTKVTKPRKGLLFDFRYSCCYNSDMINTQCTIPLGSNMFVYKITNQINNKSYIGSTSRSPEIRWKEHKQEAAKGTDYYLYRSMRHHGVENFTFEVIDRNSVELYSDLILLETDYIKKLNTLKPAGYNLTEGGIGGDRLYLYSEEVKKEKYKIIAEKNREIQKDPARSKNRKEAHKKWVDHLNANPEEKQKYIEKCSDALRETWKSKVLTEEDKEAYSSGQKKRFLKETEEEKELRIKTAKDNSGVAKSWKLTFPNGKIEIVKSIYDYCKENNLPYYVIYGCHRSKKASKHGWNLEESNDS